MASSEPLHLIVTIVSAKHLKNVNWRNGDLKPYVVIYFDQDHRLSTRSDDSFSIKPVWNEQITLPLTRSVHESILNIEILHSNHSPILVGSVRFPLARLIHSDVSMVPELITSLELLRPSGRPQGKIRLKLAINERSHRSPPPPPPPPPPLPSRRRPRSRPQNYYPTPPNNHFYSPTPQPQHDYREFSHSPSPYQFTDHYYPGYYYYPPPPPPRSMYHHASSYNLPTGPSAPVDAPPMFSNYAPPPSGPSAPVQAPPMGSGLSSYGVSSGPSAPVEYSSTGSNRRL